MALAMALLSAAASAQGLVPKQVAAPPEEILSGRLRLPDPLSVVHRTRHGELPVRWADDGRGGGRWQAEFPVGAVGPLMLVAVGFGVDDWTLEIADPGGPLRDTRGLVRSGLAARRSDEVPGWRNGPRALAVEVEASHAGDWRVAASAPRAGPSGSAVDGVVLVADASPLVLATCLTTHALLAGEPIGLRAWIERADAPGTVAPGALRSGALGPAEVLLTTPDGPHRVALHDDGRHDDGAAGDGVAGAILPDLPPGETLAAIVVTAGDADGRTVLRAAHLVLPVQPPAVMLSGRVEARPEGDALVFDIGAWVAGPPRRVQVAAEVWGTDGRGEPVAVCWLARMGEVGALGGENHLSLRLDPRWLTRAGAGAPLELRAVRVQDPDSQIPFDVRARLAVPDLAAGAPILPAVSGPASLDPVMFTGAPPPTLVPGLGHLPRGPEPFDIGDGRALVLSHGYCSGGSVWPDADFTGPKIEFLDPDANRSHDQFAQLIAAAAGRSSFGILAHSQGGNAALHLYTFYWSPLDLASGGRRIQAVASPWAGTPLAAELANLGGIFGVGCGSNDDLSESGAALWLASIPGWARDDVSFWTTSNSGSACNFLTNLFLSSPNDGVVEKVSGVLSGGNDMGHVTGWCHSTGMTNPANYTDHVRNLERNAAASR